MALACPGPTLLDDEWIGLREILWENLWFPDSYKWGGPIFAIGKSWKIYGFLGRNQTNPLNMVVFMV